MATPASAWTPTARLVVAGLAAALAGVSVILLAGLGSDAFVLAVDDYAQVIMAGVAAVAAAVRGRRTGGRLRRSWYALGAGCASWAVGQAIWSWYEVVLGQDTPFPSVADLGFLGFPLAAGIGLALYPTGALRGDSSRRLLDGLTVATAFGLVSWATALGAVVREGAEDLLTSLVGIAYPATDAVLLTMVVLLLARATTDRWTLGLIGAGIAGIAMSDSAFLYLTATGAYGSEDHAVSLGWCAGFCLLAVAAVTASRTPDAADNEAVATAVGSTFLPYVPVVVAAGVVGAQALLGLPPDPVELWLGATVVAFVLLRQYATLRDNARLAGELAAREAELRHQAFHDGLTGLANRALFQDRVQHALELHRRDRRALSVLFCDLDDFKIVNDTLGHASGDALLMRVAERLRGALRSGDTLARLGGDEFAVLLEDTEDPLRVAIRVSEALRSPFAIGDRSVSVGTSVGLTTVLFEASTPTADTLLAQADTAMYAAKRGGKGAVRVFEPGMELDELVDSDLALALTAAIEAREITLAYQPIVALATGEVTGVEALARWTRHGQPVPPSTFIPLAERTGLIPALTALVLDLACAQAAAWQSELGPSRLRVGVNLSPQSVTERGLPGEVAACLQRHGLQGRHLALEVTESGLMSDPEAARTVCSELRTLGIHVALDDFGVGYSSLAHLNLLPLDSLKLDRAFVSGLGGDRQQERFTRAVLRLGADLGLAVIAEGVEELAELELLRELGCGHAQGYLLARPAPAAEITPLLGRTLLGTPHPA
jgi:diguanylate cyclase (GGDEF)-like protein